MSKPVHKYIMGVVYITNGIDLLRLYCVCINIVCINTPYTNTPYNTPYTNPLNNGSGNRWDLFDGMGIGAPPQTERGERGGGE
jgi:hypothetical protein